LPKVLVLSSILSSIDVIRAALFCLIIRTYRYWAIDVDDRANVSTVAQGITDITDDLNSRLPAALQEDPNGFRYFPILTTQSDLDARVQHAVQPTVVALVLFGVLAALATLLLAVLASARNLRQSR
jgi:chorismate mutase